MSVDKFWSNDVTVLFDKDKLSEFFPTNTMSIEEVLNALVRASLYLSICLFVYKRNVNVFFISIGTLVITYLIYKYSPTLKGKDKDKGNSKGNSKNGSDSKRGEDENTEGFESRYESDEFLQDKVCVTPTVNNPFMNVAISDYKNMPNREVCDDLLDNPNIKQDIESKFNHGLYQDVGDIWGKNNSQRQFYTMPNTSIPNKQKEFALWLYNRGPTCKEGNGYQCFANLHHSLRLNNLNAHPGTGPVT
jgi:hypothetical protein